jgi:hypothetical protein
MQLIQSRIFMVTCVLVLSCLGCAYGTLTINTGPFANTTLQAAQYYWKGKRANCLTNMLGTTSANKLDVYEELRSYTKTNLLRR